MKLEPTDLPGDFLGCPKLISCTVSIRGHMRLWKDFLLQNVFITMEIISFGTSKVNLFKGQSAGRQTSGLYLGEGVPVILDTPLMHCLAPCINSFQKYRI